MKCGTHKDPYAWNYFLYKEFARRVSRHSKWIVYLCHGFFQQQRCMMSGSAVSLSLIARRSRHLRDVLLSFSQSNIFKQKKTGTRYLKRGVSDDGYVANDVEVEQIIDDEDRHYSSYVQVRGSCVLDTRSECDCCASAD